MHRRIMSRRSNFHASAVPDPKRIFGKREAPHSYALVVFGVTDSIRAGGRVSDRPALNRLLSRLRYVGGALVSACSALPSAMTDSSPVRYPLLGNLKIEMVGYFTAQTISGVAATRSGRLFVSLIQPGATVSTAIGEVSRGVIRSYPTVAWNAIRSGGDLTNELTYVFASVQAIEIDHHSQNRSFRLTCRRQKFVDVQVMYRRAPFLGYPRKC